MGMRGRLFIAALGGVSLLACGLDDRGGGASTTVVGLGGNPSDSGLGGAAGSAAAAGGGASGSGGLGGDGATGATGATAATGGGGGAENCTDGVDNDGDGATDCADPDCAEYSCVPQAPPGFIGFSRLRGETYPPASGEGPLCPDGSTPLRYLSKPAGAPQCSACECGALTDAACGPATLMCTHDATDCTGAQDWSSKISGSCKNGDGGKDKLSCFANPASPTQSGSCTPTVSSVTDSEMFAEVSDVCRQPAGQGCAAGQACVKNGAGEYGGFICVEQPGEVACPSEYSLAIVGYQSGQDGRSCSACQCTPGQVTCDAPEFSFYDGLGCSLSRRTVTSTTCQNLSGLLDWSAWSYKTTHAPQAFGNCSAQGGLPQGAVVGVGAITFCCRSVL